MFKAHHDRIRQKVEDVLQLAALKMSPTETAVDFAFDVVAPRVECAVKVSVSTPADFMTFCSQCPSVAGLTGLRTARKSGLPAFACERFPQRHNISKSTDFGVHWEC